MKAEVMLRIERNLLRLLTALLCVLFYDEFFSYWILRLQWQYIPRSSVDQNNELRMLFVADPQIQGYHDEPKGVGIFTRWDIDRYLRRTFQQAYAHTRPDVVVFLGDLLDEGTSATDNEFHEYWTRVQSIFAVDNNVQRLFIPGDNDIGGEGFDQRTQKKIARFFAEQELLSNSHVTHLTSLRKLKFVDFILMNYNFGESLHADGISQIEAVAKNFSAKYRLIVNHMSFMERGRHDFHKVMGVLRPHAIISAHSHKGVLYTCKNCYRGNRQLQRSADHDTAWMSQPGYEVPLTGTLVHLVDIDSELKLNEIMIPTCSYRMGVSNMGYGYATLDSTGQLKYTTLWLPSRYFQLQLDVYIIVLLVLLMLVWLLIRWGCLPRHSLPFAL